MGGSLSQEEIDRLLGGGAGSDDTSDTEAGSSDVIADTAASGASPINGNGNINQNNNIPEEVVIPNEMERGLLGEIYNISMGAAAQAVATLVKMKVDITTPNVRILKKGELVFKALEPAVGVRINYIEGIEGENVFILSQLDIMKLVDIVLGGTGEIDETAEFTEMHMSAVGEIMNQMMGASSMNIAEFLNLKIDISVPETFKIESDYPMRVDSGDEWIVATDFKFIVGDIINSEMISTCSLPFAKDLIYKAMQNFGMVPEEMSSPAPEPTVAETPAVQQPEPEPTPYVAEPPKYEEPVQVSEPIPQTAPPPMEQPQPQSQQPQPMTAEQQIQQPTSQAPPYQPMPQQQAPMGGGQGQYQQPYYYPQTPGPGFDQMYAMFAEQQRQMMQLIEKISMNQVVQPPQSQQSYPNEQERHAAQPASYNNNQQSQSLSGNVNIQPASFINFDTADDSSISFDNMDLVLDLPLDVAIEIGKTRKTVNEVLELGEGSVIELDKQVAEPVDICVNGNLIARGSVVVIEENFAVRITEIVSPQDKIKAARARKER